MTPMAEGKDAAQAGFGGTRIISTLTTPSPTSATTSCSAPSLSWTQRLATEGEGAGLSGGAHLRGSAGRGSLETHTEGGRLRHAHEASALAQQLYAAKQVTWRGQSELPQLPWPQPRQGLVLVVDMWSGIGGLLVALLALGVRCIAVSAEQDPAILPAVKQHFPHAVHVTSVEDLQGEDFLPVLQRRSFSAVLLGGGSPCQGNSALNLGRRGWQGPRSQQPKHLQRLVRELR